MPLVLTDARHPDHPIILANKAFLNLTGYESREVLGGNCRFLQGEYGSSCCRPTSICHSR
ncbi:PAS domain-containing protein [Agrobacterium sp. Ap1]|uniref:PAS domain-containing protein n=1 Tax=Agrobacterium sp. Ap1 TaxID=2815337 RepID=UPI00336BE6DC